MTDVAHLGPVELLTPEGERSLAFFTEVMGLEIEGQEGPTTYLRGWGDYQRYSLALTESDTSGMAFCGLRAWSPEALERRVAAVEATGLGEGWTEGARGRGPGYRFRDPDGHTFELYYDVERYDPPEHLRPSLKNQPPALHTGRGAAVKRLDHVNVLAADVRASREFAQQALDYRLYERIELDDGSEAGAWLSASIAAHELIYTRATRTARAGASTTSPSGSTRGRSAFGPPTSSSTTTFTSRRRRPSTRSHRACFLYGIRSPSGIPHRGDHRRLLRLRPRSKAATVVWSAAERAKGQAWGVHTVESFHTYGTPPVPGAPLAH